MKINNQINQKRFTSKCGWDVIQTEEVKEIIEEEIKEIQGEVGDLVDGFFKKKFYNPTTQDNMDFEELKQEIKKIGENENK